MLDLFAGARQRFECFAPHRIVRFQHPTIEHYSAYAVWAQYGDASAKRCQRTGLPRLTRKVAKDSAQAFVSVRKWQPPEWGWT